MLQMPLKLACAMILYSSLYYIHPSASAVGNVSGASPMHSPKSKKLVESSREPILYTHENCIIYFAGVVVEATSICKHKNENLEIRSACTTDTSVTSTLVKPSDSFELQASLKVARHISLLGQALASDSQASKAQTCGN